MANKVNEIHVESINRPAVRDSEWSDADIFSDEETSSLAGSFEELGRDDYEEESSSYPSDHQAREDIAQKRNLRRHLDKLAEMVIEKEFLVKRAREDEKSCQVVIQRTEKDIEKVQEEIEDAEATTNSASLCRLKAKYEKLCAELMEEQSKEEASMLALRDAEFSLAQVYIEHGKFFPAEEEGAAAIKLNDKAIVADKAAVRTKKESLLVAAAERKRRNREKDHVHLTRERERRHRHAVSAAKRNREIAFRYLKSTMERVRQRESEEEERNRTEMQHRMNALLNLRRNVIVSKESLKESEARQQAINITTERKSIKEQQRLIDEGLNQDEASIRIEKMNEFEKDQRHFERLQRQREIDIANKLLSEEKQIKRRQQQQPYLWPDKSKERTKRFTKRKTKPRVFPSSGSESMEYSADIEDTGGKIKPHSQLARVSSDDEGEFSPYGATSRDEPRTEESEEDLLQPEFKGLWDSQRNSAEKTKGAQDEHQALGLLLHNQKKSTATRKQHHGKEIKGPAYSSKPAIVIFKDFDAGAIYRKKVVLTNISYSQNTCSFVGMTENLKDFIDVSFTPPGIMSAGLTCDLTVTFQPKVIEDLYGEIQMISQNGLFIIPLHCLTKKCVVSLSHDKILFGNVIIGETIKKTLTITNSGALPTDYLINTEDDVDDYHDHSENTFDDQQDTASSKSPSYFLIEKGSSGYLESFSSVKIEIVCSPKIPAALNKQFSVITNSDELLFSATAFGIDIPVWLERKIVDLQICMYGRLYQDTIIIHSRATSALGIQFEVPKCVREHLEILPKAAYVQAESQFSAQLKFLPRRSFVDNASSFFDANLKRYDIPITLRVAEQHRPVHFNVVVAVTSSDLEFDCRMIDFGMCTIFESVTKTIVMTNRSILPHSFAFVQSSEIFSVQPADGFGEILPEQMITLTAVFSPIKPEDYSVLLLCKTAIGNEFTIVCKGTGTDPLLRLSHNVINFKPTAIGDCSIAKLTITNPHEHNKTASLFEFVTSDESPLQIAPRRGFIHPGQTSLVEVRLKPDLDVKEIIAEVKRLAVDRQKHLHQAQEDNTRNKDVAIVAATTKDQKSKLKNSKSTVKSSKAMTRTATPQSLHTDNDIAKQCDDYSPETVDYAAARRSLLEGYKDTLLQCKVTCAVSNPTNPDGNTQPSNTNLSYLYIDVVCPITKPSFIVSSTSIIKNNVLFGDSVINQRSLKSIKLKNLTSAELPMSISCLDPHGPFELIKCMRPIPPLSSCDVVISFQPTQVQKYFEQLEISSKASSQLVAIFGQGISPSLIFSLSGTVLDCGNVLKMETTETSFTITNVSSSGFCIELNVASQRSSSLYKSQCYNSVTLTRPSAFNCHPVRCTIEPGQTIPVSVLFSPGAECGQFKDTLTINVNQVESYSISLHGNAWPNLGFALGWHSIDAANFDTSTALPTVSTLHRLSPVDDKSSMRSVLLWFVCQCDENGTLHSNVQNVQLGCVKSIGQGKKVCEFVFDNMKDATDNGFTIEPMKGLIEEGTTKQIEFKWSPMDMRQDAKMIQPLQCHVNMQLKSDITEFYDILLRANVKDTV